MGVIINLGSCAPHEQTVLQAVRRSTAPDEQRRALFSWIDATTGMTCLMLAASRNMVEIMKLVRAWHGAQS